MFLDKNIETFKIKKLGKSPSEVEEIQKVSIKHIRSISTELGELLNQISDYQSSMVSPNASPINKKYRSGPSNNTQSKQDKIDLSFFKKIKKETEKQQAKKKTHGSVHYTTYMKPIHNMKQKIKQILEEQKKQKEIEQERERILLQKLKKKSIKNYATIQPKYNKYDDIKVEKAQAIANRTMQKQFQQMQGVTFTPKINKNVEITQSFNQRLLTNEYKKHRKQVEIIKDVLKEQTHKPKINSHVQSESKIKTIWIQSPNTSKKNSINNQSFGRFSKIKSYEPDQQSRQQNSPQIKANIKEVEFMLEKRLFDY